MKKGFSTTSEPLPLTRKAQLLDVLRHRFFEVVLASIYTFLFSAPMLVWLLFANYNLLQAKDLNIFHVVVTYGVLIPCFMVFSLGLAGGLYFFKCVAFQTGSDVNKDFFIGIGKNYKQFLLYSFFISFLYFALKVSTIYLNRADNLSNVAVIIITGVMYAFLFIFLIIISMQMSQSILYEVTLLQSLNNSVRLFIGNLFSMLGIFVITFLPFLVFEFVPYYLAQWISYGVCLVFYFGFSQMVFMLYSISIFDKTINIKRYPEIFRKGLAKEEEQTHGND